LVHLAADDETGGDKMEFRLIYDGPLPAEKCRDRGEAGGGAVGRAKDKHHLRKSFHPQLRELWKQDPGLHEQAERFFRIDLTPHNRISYPGPGVREIVAVMPGEPGSKRYIDHIADSHVYCGNRFVPLVSQSGGFSCALDILLLRRQNPGNLVDNGDIDNRMKVLFDGLRVPKKEAELGGYSFDLNEDPFFCLLEDDALVTSVSITTDRLILPARPNEQPEDVLLIIHVTIVNPTALFAGGRLI
jgi:hypothetical protein